MGVLAVRLKPTTPGGGGKMSEVFRFRLDLAGCSDPQCISLSYLNRYEFTSSSLFDGGGVSPPELKLFRRLRPSPPPINFSGAFGGGKACASWCLRIPKKGEMASPNN
jgi:hypothetical protein